MWNEDSKPHQRNMGKAKSGFLLTLLAAPTIINKKDGYNNNYGNGSVTNL